LHIIFDSANTSLFRQPNDLSCLHLRLIEIFQNILRAYSLVQIPQVQRFPATKPSTFNWKVSPSMTENHGLAFLPGAGSMSSSVSTSDSSVPTSDIISVMSTTGLKRQKVHPNVRSFSLIF
jgi:hypothetical protein